MERRITPRARLTRTLWLNKYLEGFPHLAELLELSEDGMLIRTIHEPWNRESTFTLELGIPGSSHRLWMRARAPSRRATGRADSLRGSPRSSPAQAARSLVLCSIFVASALAALACRRDDAQDQVDLRAALSADEKTSQTLKRVDDLVRAGNVAEARDLLKRVAEPAANDAIGRADALTPRTVWGQREKGALVSVTAERKAEMAHYARSLDGTDDDKLDALTKQVELETRAAALMQEIDRGP